CAAYLCLRAGDISANRSVHGLTQLGAHLGVLTHVGLQHAPNSPAHTLCRQFSYLLGSHTVIATRDDSALLPCGLGSHRVCASLFTHTALTRIDATRVSAPARGHMRVLMCDEVRLLSRGGHRGHRLIDVNSTESSLVGGAGRHTCGHHPAYTALPTREFL